MREFKSEPKNKMKTIQELNEAVDQVAIYNLC